MKCSFNRSAEDIKSLGGLCLIGQILKQLGIADHFPSSKILLVEAAGIEPASVTGSPEISTCLVGCYLTCGEASRHATPKARFT